MENNTNCFDPSDNLYKHTSSNKYYVNDDGKKICVENCGIIKYKYYAVAD